MSDLDWKVKGQPWPLKLISNISSENNDFVLNSFKKWTFQKKIPFKSIRKQIWPWRLVGQGQLRFIIWTNLVGSTSTMLHSKSQGHRHLVLEKILKHFYHIWAWRPSWSCDQNILHQFWLTYHKESSHENWVQLGQWFVGKLCLNMLMGLQYEQTKLKGQRSTVTFGPYL